MIPHAITWWCNVQGIKQPTHLKPIKIKWKLQETLGNGGRREILQEFTKIKIKFKIWILFVPEGLEPHYLKSSDDLVGYPCQAPPLKHDSPLSYKLDIYRLACIFAYQNPLNITKEAGNNLKPQNSKNTRDVAYSPI